MTLFQAPILTDGADHSAQQFRMLVRDLSNGAEGITQGDDLKVSPLSTPGTSVRVGDGSGIIRGKANSFQGSYSACNIGSQNVPIASTGGSPRSDMVVLRVLDPEYEGDLDPSVDQIMFFDTISNVGSTATTVPDGYSAIPLARVDIPASTSTIISGMITDIRQCANPRRSRLVQTQSPTGALVEFGGTSGSWLNWTNVPGWFVPVPSWASKAIVTLTVCQLRYSTGIIVGSLRSSFGSSLTLQATILDDNATGTRRATVAVADTLTIPSAYRGTTQVMRPEISFGASNAGKAGMDTSVTLISDVEFVEAPR